MDNTNNVELVASLSSNEILDGKIVTGEKEVTTSDHNELLNRDLPEQHPIRAIIGLEKELMSIKNNHSTATLSIKNKIRTVKEIPDDMQVGEYIFLEKESE